MQDDIKVNPQLTLNAGLRYEYATPQYEEDNFLTNFDPATNSLIIAKDGSVYDRALVNPDRNNFAPRLGAAWAVDREDGRPRRLRHELHPLQPDGRREPALVQRSARRRPQHQPDDQPAAVRRQRRTRPAASAPRRQGYPEGFTTPASFNPLNVRVNYIPKDTRTGNVTSWHASVQREILTNLLVDVGYVGNKSRDILILGDFNQARPNAAGENASLQARRPIQGFQEIQVGVRRRQG